MKQSDRSPHRTDQQRGSRRRVADGVFERAGKYLVSYTDGEGTDRVKTVGWVKSDKHPDGVTLTEARRMREKLRVQVSEGELPVPTRTTFGEVAEDFLAMFESLVAAGEKSERTAEVYRQRYRTHLEPELARVHVQKLTAAHVSRLLAKMRAQGKASWTITGVYRLLGVILSHAVSRSLINDTPLKRLSRSERPSPKNASKARVLTDGEIDSLLHHALPGYRALLATAAFTGMRQSELLGLRWRDVDFEEAVIHVRHQLTRATKQTPPRLKRLKTDAAERDVYLLPRLRAALTTHRAAAFAHGLARPEDFVFATEAGTSMYYRNVATGGLDTAAKRAGLNPPGMPKLTMHDLRHTFISRLIAGGLDVVHVQRQAGHAKPSITLDKYAQEFKKAQNLRDSVRARIEATGFGV